jgi:hypothetical protein
MRSEAAYQRYLIHLLQRIFPDCHIIKNDALARQGIPDLLILWGNRWAMLEVKRSDTAPVQPNQEYYVELFNGMSFAAFICPENEEQVLHGLQAALGSFR